MVIVVMGVSGSGKTTVGSLLARTLGWRFADADDYHPPENVRKMHAGIPLTDEDRAPWLDALHALVCQWVRHGTDAVLACSALKRAYRVHLRCDAGDATSVRFVFLKGDFPLIAGRMLHRGGHFMPESLLASQFAALEEPGLEEAVVEEVSLPPDEIVRRIRQAVGR